MALRGHLINVWHYFMDQRESAARPPLFQIAEGEHHDCITVFISRISQFFAAIRFLGPKTSSLASALVVREPVVEGGKGGAPAPPKGRQTWAPVLTSRPPPFSQPQFTVREVGTIVPSSERREEGQVRFCL